MTPDEIKELQKSGIDYYGWPLAVDGKLGYKSNWWAGINSLSTDRQDLLRFALAHHANGEKEEPSIQNGGTFVDMVLKPSGLKNQPWCAAYVSYCYKQTGVPLPKYFTSAWGIIEWAKKNGKLVDKPLPGDIVAYLHPVKQGDTQRKGHVEMNLAVDSEWVYDIGGNVTDAIRVGKRKITPEMKFIRTLDSQHGPLSIPHGMMRLDNLGDR